jgi:hypothetical protein
MVLRIILTEVTGEWRKLHNEELNDITNIIQVIKLRRMR